MSKQECLASHPCRGSSRRGSMAAREFDIIIAGGPGFSGKLAVAALASHAKTYHSLKLPNAGSALPGVKYMLMGRDEIKLKETAKACGFSTDVGVITVTDLTNDIAAV